MDNLRDTRQAYQELGMGGSGGSSLPSLWHRGRHLGKPDSTAAILKTKGGNRFPPAPPRLRGRCEVAAPPRAQLSQSAPAMTKPVLDSSCLVQARAHIQNRLRCGETEKSSYGPKGSFPALCPGPIRNPKLLAPIEGRHSAGGVLPGLKHHSPLKPLSLLPLNSMPSRLRRERLSRTTVSPRRGSEESGCSSTSSQSSIDLEEEDDQNGRYLRGTTAKQHSGEERLDLDLQPADSPHKATEIRHRHIPDLLSFKDINSTLWFERGCEEGVVAAERTTCSGGLIKETTKTEPTTTCTFTPGNKDMEVNDNEKTSGVNTTNYQRLPSPVKVPLCELNLPTRVKIKATKQNKIIKKRSSTSVQNKTNQSFNILADKEHIRGNTKSSKNVRNLSVPSHSLANVRKPAEVISGEATVKSRIISTKTGQRSTDMSSLRIRNTEPSCQSGKKLNNDRKSLTKISEPCQKPIEQREPKTARRPMKTGEIQSTPRSKSAIDSITYSDMFREIDIGTDQGPVIYEMFAGPVFDNIRVSRSKGCERNRQVQSAQSRNVLTHRPKRKCPKPLESNRQRRSPVDNVVSTKGKQRKNRTIRPISRGKSSLTPIDITDDKDNTVVISGLNWRIHPQAETEPVNSRDERETVVAEEHMLSLSVIEEMLSSHASDTLIHQWRPDETSQTKSNHTSQSDPGDDSLCVEENKGSKENNGSGSGHNNGKADHLDHSSAWSHSPAQTKINTWTSGGCDSMSPVFQKFLDGVGEGPLTEELLKCLAEELISLDKRECVSLCSENNSDKERESKNNSAPRREKSSQRDVISPGGVLSESRLVMDDAITWTKGEVLGRGAYGTVFCGLTSQGQLIAVKQVALDTMDLDTANKEYSRLQQEVDLLKNVRHSNIVGFLGTSFRDNVVSIFMEYVPGGSIASVLHRFGPLPERILALYTRQVLEGVSYLHLNRVIHRDLKGNNLMLMPTGVVKLIDFGCARRLSCLTNTNSRSDLLRSAHGTPYWMAPEVINETGHGRKSDIWSVGCTVFEMATGKPPLSHMNKMAALFYIGVRRGLMPSLPGAFSEDARDFVQVCLTSDQKQRPTAEQLLDHPFITKDEVILV